MATDLGTQIAAAVRVAVDEATAAAAAAALESFDPAGLVRFFHPSLAHDVDSETLGVGLPASPGAASGRIVLTADEALTAADAGDAVILVREQTSPDDVMGMQASAGILTCRGGLASHAAVVARGWGIPAVVGASSVSIDGDSVVIGDMSLRNGDIITIDGSTGNVYAGRLAMSSEHAPPELDVLLGWADTVAAGHVDVRANADTVTDAATGRRLGARGIGLCRTEHMFLAPDRLPMMRRFILADDASSENAALAVLEAAQVVDFEQVLVAMDGLPVTVRLLDPPLHEFLPDLVELVAREAAGDIDEASLTELAAVRRLHEVNPMIGTRGVRLGVIRSGLYEMQIRAVCRAVANLFERGARPVVEVMIPLVIDAEELRIARSWVTGVLDEVAHSELAWDAVSIGAMIETPRAALTAAALADHADFFSFGTNDLTQLTYAFSRDDVESALLPAYLAAGILADNPFAKLDEEGVGELIRIACDAARSVKPEMKIGVCGEHAGDAGSIDFLVRLGVDSLSCSPYRVPIARLAAAQALLASGRVNIDDVIFDYGPATSTADGDEPTDDQPPLDHDERLVMHILRIRGFVTVEGFVESVGSHPERILAELIDRADVRYIEARGIYALTPSGRVTQQSLVDIDAADGVHAGLVPIYEAFLPLNVEFKQLCTTWQMRGDEPNDHTDTAYDRSCRDELVRFHASAQHVIEAFATTLPRMARYGDRLRQALSHVAEGEDKMFTGVGCGSFHDVWMELHEDLIVLLNINRTQEGSF